MLVLLPPSEGKATPSRRSAVVDLDRLSFPELTATRSRLMDELAVLCSDDADKARSVLGLSPGLATEVERDRTLRSAPTLPVSSLYTGVLYDALDLATLDGPARRRATRWLVVVSALWGALRLSDRVPAYRLSPDVSLPGTGPVAALWRDPLRDALAAPTARGLVVDLRSTGYASMWRPSADVASTTVTVRVLHERTPGDTSSRVVVSHFNKATKGRLVRAVLESGADPRTPEALRRLLEDLGHMVVLRRPDSPCHLDVVVREL